MKYLKLAFKILLIGIIFFFIVRNLYSNWDQLERLDFQLNHTYWILSLVALLLGWIATVWILKRLFAIFKYEISFADVFIIYSRSMVGKYIPGKFWQIAGTTYLAARRGVPEEITITSMIFGQTCSVLAGLIIFGLVLALGSLGETGGIISKLQWTSIPIVVLMLLFALKPKLIEKPVNLVLRLLKRDSLKIDIEFRNAVEILLLTGAIWFIFGLGFWLFAKAITGVGFDQYIRLTAINSAAVVIGFLTLFAPGGFGVREGIMVLLLSSLATFPTPLPAAIALGFRIIMTVSEIILFGLTWIVKWFSR